MLLHSIFVQYLSENKDYEATKRWLKKFPALMDYTQVSCRASLE